MIAHARMSLSEAALALHGCLSLCCCTWLTLHVCGKQFLLCHTGKFGYYLTFTLQWLNLLCANVGLVVLAGQSLKVICPGKP